MAMEMELSEHTKKRVLNKLASFGPMNRVFQTPKRVLDYSEGIEYMAHTCKVWNTILYIKPILEMLANDTDGVLHITLEKFDLEGTKALYFNSDGVQLGEDVYKMETILIDEIKMYYMLGTLFLPNEYNHDWFFNEDDEPKKRRP
jgi:hypothetical protein